MKLLKSLLAGICIITAPILNVTACVNKVDVFKLNKEDVKNSVRQKQYIENSTFIAKSFIFSEQKKMQLDNVLNDILNSPNNKNLKVKLNQNFNVNSLLNADFDSLFSDENLKLKLLNSYSFDSLADFKHNQNFFSVIKLLLLFIKDIVNDTETLIKSDFLQKFLQKNLEKVFQSYRQNFYYESLMYLQKKLAEHNQFINKTYKDILPWAVNNVKNAVFNIINLPGIKNYDELMQKSININLSIFKPSTPSFNINSDIQLAFIKNIKNIKDNYKYIIDLAISAIPIISYLLNTANKIPLKNVKDSWTFWLKDNKHENDSKNNLLVNSKSVIQNNNNSTYQGLTSLLFDFQKNYQIITNWNDEGLNLRKVLITILLNDDLFTFFKPFEISINLLDGVSVYKKNILELIAPNTICATFKLFGYCVGGRKENIFVDAFSQIKAQIYEKLETPFSYLTKASDYIELIKMQKLDDNTILLLIENILNKMSFKDIDIQSLINVQNNPTDFFDKLNEILNSEGVFASLIKNIQEKNNILTLGMNKVFDAVKDKGYISNIIEENNKVIDNFYLQSFFKDTYWSKENEFFSAKSDAFIISYVLSYHPPSRKKVSYEISFKTISLVDERLILTKFHQLEN